MSFDPKKIISGYITLSLMKQLLHGDRAERYAVLQISLATATSMENCNYFLKTLKLGETHTITPKVDVKV